MIFEVGDKVYARDLKIEGTVTKVREHTLVTGKIHVDVLVSFPGYDLDMGYTQGSRTLRKVKSDPPRFYCEDCRARNNWPAAYMGSTGPCGACDEDKGLLDRDTPK